MSLGETDLSTDTNLREQKLGELLADALDLPADQRLAYLQSSGEHPSLIAEVAQLLGREDELTGMLLQPAARLFDLGSDSDLFETLPSDDGGQPGRIGPYNLLYCLGEGGMGRVYLAEQTEPVERRVALKLALRVQTHPEARRRFLLERRALGRLAHPNIARLYEAGTTPEGRAWVAMELVDGPRITEYCDQRSLSISDRIKLFVEICRGAHHAHQKQILHRDLKPANILVEEVDGQPVAKIIDFGIAKALDQPFDHTFATGNRLLGTPHYMSPEALEPATHADIDTRSDIYSLGVVLYELITGVRPFVTPASDLARLLREILDEELRPPSLRLESLDAAARYRLSAARGCEPESHLAMLSGDLDWIVTKAMAKARDQRYGSAAELADELQRFLEHLPILARPPSHFYRLGKFLRRNRSIAFFTSIVTAGLIFTSVLAAVALVRAREAEERSRIHAETAERSLGFMVELFDTADSDAELPYEITARDLLVEGVSRLRAAELSPESRSQLLHTLGEVHLRLGLYPTARELLTESLELRRREGPADADDVLATTDLLGHVERLSGRLDVAEPLLEGVLSARRQQEVYRPLLLADAQTSLARLRWDQGFMADAEGLFRRALSLRGAVLDRTALEVAASYRELGNLLLAAERYDEAAVSLRAALEGLEHHLGPKHPEVGETLENLARVLRESGHFAESELVLRRTLDIYRSNIGPEHPKTARVHEQLASLLIWLGRFDEAEVSGRRVAAIRSRTLGEDHPQALRANMVLGEILALRGSLSEAEEILRQVLARPSEDLLDTRRLLARIWLDQGNIEAAEGQLTAILDQQKGIRAENPLEWARIHLLLGELELRRGDLGRAETILESSLDAFRQLEGTGLEQARTLFALAETLRSRGNRAEAERFHLRSLEIRRQVLVEGHPDLTKSEAAVAGLR